MEHDGDIVACGGYSVSSDNVSARLLWGIVRSDLQRQGLGRFLVMYRLREIGKQNGIQVVQVKAPLSAAPFFEKQGFRTVNIQEHHVELIKRLVVCG